MLNLEGVVALAMRRKNSMRMYVKDANDDETTRWAVLVTFEEMAVIVDEYRAQNPDVISDELAQHYKDGIAMLIIEGPEQTPITILPEYEMVSSILKRPLLNG